MSLAETGVEMSLTETGGARGTENDNSKGVWRGVLSATPPWK